MAVVSCRRLHRASPLTHARYVCGGEKEGEATHSDGSHAASGRRPRASRAEIVVRALRQARLQLEGRDGQPVGPVAQDVVKEIVCALGREPALRRLRRGIDQALSAKVPISTTVKFSRMMHCGRSTLWRQWRSAFGSAMPVSLFLELVTAKRYQDLRDQGLGSEEAAAHIGLTQKALSKRCQTLRRRLVGSRK